MAGLVAGATGAALTAIVMTFEMTLDYSVVLPMTLTVAVSHGLRRLILEQNIYTMKLARRGHYMPQALQANAHLVHHVEDMTMATAASIRVDADPSRLAIHRGTGRPRRTSCFATGSDGWASIAREWAESVPEALRTARVLGESRPTRLRAGAKRHDRVRAHRRDAESGGRVRGRALRRSPRARTPRASEGS